LAPSFFEIKPDCFVIFRRTKQYRMYGTARVSKRFDLEEARTREIK
jgi:hypothetical protein